MQNLNLVLLASFALACPNVHAIDLVFDSATMAQVGKVLDEAGKQVKALNDQLNALGRLETYVGDYKALADAVNTIRNANNAFHQAQSLYDQVEGIKQRYGSVDGWLSQYKSVDAWRNHPCFNGAGCTPAQRAVIDAAAQTGSRDQKAANDAQAKAIEAKIKEVEASSAALDGYLLRANATRSAGESAAIANGIAGVMAKQMLDLNQMVIAAQKAELAGRMDATSKEAMQQAATASLTGNTIKLSKPVGWRF